MKPFLYLIIFVSVFTAIVLTAGWPWAFAFWAVVFIGNSIKYSGRTHK